MIILHNPNDPISNAVVSAHPEATIIAWYADSLPEGERRLHEAARKQYIEDGGPQPSAFPCLVVATPAYGLKEAGLDGVEILTWRGAERRCLTLGELPHAAFRIALAHAAAGEALPSQMRALWPPGVPLPEDIEIIDLQPAPLVLAANPNPEAVPASGAGGAQEQIGA